MDIFSYEASRRIGEEDVLTKIDALMDWPSIEGVLTTGLDRSGVGRSGLGRSRFGPTGYAPLLLFKCLLLGQWHGLSDPKLERALRVRLDFMVFCGLDLHAPVPDETTHCRFRNALVEADVFDAVLAQVCRQLEDHGLKLQEAEAAIIEASLVESAARPNKYIAPVKDRHEEKADTDDPAISFSADRDGIMHKAARGQGGSKGAASSPVGKTFQQIDQ